MTTVIRRVIHRSIEKPSREEQAYAILKTPANCQAHSPKDAMYTPARDLAEIAHTEPPRCLSKTQARCLA